MISVAEALAQVIGSMKETCIEQVSLSDALGRVLATDVTARLTQPWADVSAMDGYAVRAADVAHTPVMLTVIGESAAGGCYAGTVGAGQAVRIFTGAPLPPGTDTIVIQENTERTHDQVNVLEGAPKGKFVRSAGMDFKTGDGLLRSGRVLSARDLGLAASGNVPWLHVKRRPRIAIIATGDEVVMPGDTLGPNQIISSNSVLLSAYVKSLGAVALDLGIARDDAASLTRLVQYAREADLLVTSGGASVGDHDLVNQVLGKEGVDLGFYKVAMRPGKPLIFGHLHGTPVLGLPGNPVSVGVTAAIFLRPAILAMLGLDPATHVETAILGCALGENDQRQEYLRATLAAGSDGKTVATPFSKQDSAMMAKFADADCLVIRAPFAPPAQAGTEVEIIRL